MRPSRQVFLLCLLAVLGACTSACVAAVDPLTGGDDETEETSEQEVEVARTTIVPRMRPTSAEELGIALDADGRPYDNYWGPQGATVERRSFNGFFVDRGRLEIVEGEAFFGAAPVPVRDTKSVDFRGVEELDLHAIWRQEPTSSDQDEAGGDESDQGTQAGNGDNPDGGGDDGGGDDGGGDDGADGGVGSEDNDSADDSDRADDSDSADDSDRADDSDSADGGADNDDGDGADDGNDGSNSAGADGRQETDGQADGAAGRETIVGLILAVPDTTVARWGSFAPAYRTEEGLGAITSRAVLEWTERNLEPDTATLDADVLEDRPFALVDVDQDEIDDLLLFDNGTDGAEGAHLLSRGFNDEDIMVAIMIWHGGYPWRLAVPEGEPPPDVVERELELIECIEGRRLIDRWNRCT